MAELKLVNPEDFKPSKAEQVIGAGGSIVSHLTVFGSVIEFGLMAYRTIKNRSLMSGKALISPTQLQFERSNGEREDIHLKDITRLEFHYYSASTGNLGLQDKMEEGAHLCTTFTVHTEQDSYTGNTLAGKRACRQFLTECYEAGIRVKDYRNSCRTYRLKTMMYADIQELKKQYGEDFW